MNIEQLYTECLAQGAYYIKSKNEAVIIDPLREVNQYIEKANKDGPTSTSSEHPKSVPSNANLASEFLII